MPLVTREAVEIARVGEWSTSTGKWKCTRAQLADAVRAQASGRFRNAVIKPGHTDPRFDGEPALGQIRNLRLAEGGESLVGDLLIPDWLDDEMPAVYPSRSVEADLGVETADGERFGMVVTGIALLGVTKPAIQSLAELEHRFMPVAASEYVAAMSVAAAFDEAAHPRGAKGAVKDAKPKAKPAMKVKAAADEAASRFADVDPDLWCREVLEDVVVYVNAAGMVWTAPWSEDQGEVLIGDPRPVTVSYTPMADSIAAAAMHNMHRPLVASRAGLDVRHVTASQGAASVDITPEMREALGVDENADEAAVLTALKGLKSPAVTSPQDQENPVGDSEGISLPSEDHDQDKTVAPIVVEAEVEKMVAARIAASEKRSDALIAALSGELAARKAKEAADHKTSVLASAARAGKFTPADRAAWEKDYDEAPQATERILARMAPGTAVPIAASGYAGDGEAQGDDVDKIVAEFEALLGGGTL